ncbi:hypothetical protein STEG23_032220, partial [Scotinomys teguina]
MSILTACSYFFYTVNHLANYSIIHSGESYMPSACLAWKYHPIDVSYDCHAFGRDQDCSLKNRELDVLALLVPGSWRLEQGRQGQFGGCVYPDRKFFWDHDRYGRWSFQ